MAVYVCLGHKEPRSFRSSSDLYFHIVYEHRDCFSRLPDDYHRGLRRTSLLKFVCKCGHYGFNSLRDLIAHLRKCRGLHIVYRKGFLKQVDYKGGLSKEDFEKIISGDRRGIKEVAKFFGLSAKIAGDAERIAEMFHERTKLSRTRGVDAASLYIAAVINDEWISQREIAFAFETTEVTLRKWYKEIIEKLNIRHPS